MARLSPDRTFRGSSDSFPLSAIAGQRDMALALILLGLAPSLGGLLLVGEKGTAKSTAARALAEVLPSFAARDCPYHCRPDLSFEMCPACRETIGEVRLTRPPFRTVPLGVSEERLLGGLDWEATLKGGSPRLRPGILGEANYGLAYVDEVNLLDPNLAHLLLDAASSGRVRVERDGLSLWHPAKFALLGSMNPEEGPLGPQLSDRFALTVRLSGEKDPSVRTRIIENRLAFENDPVGFRAKHRPRNLAISSQIRTARHFFNLLVPAPETSAKAVKLALAAGAAGHRADLGLCSAARAMKAWAMAGAEIFEVYAQALRDGRLSPPEHVLSEPPYVSLFDSSSRSLDFRFLTRPAHLFGHIGDDRPDEPLSPSALFADDSSPAESLALALDRTIQKSLAPVKVLTVEPEWLDLVQDYVLPERRRAPKAAATKAAKTVIKKTDGALEPNLPTLILAGEPEIPPDFHLESFDPGEQVHLTIYEAADSYEIITPQTKKNPGRKDRTGRSGWRETLKARGRVYKTTARRLGRPISLSATLRAAAPHQAARRRQLENDPRAVILRSADFREKVYRLKTGRLVVFVVDSSGSIGTLYRMEEAKAAALALLADSYRKRDRVAVIAFYGYAAELLLPPTNSPDLAGKLLASLPSGGKTPMAAALAMTQKVVSAERLRDPRLSPYVILMTDGRPNIPLDPSMAPWPEVLHMASRLASDPTIRFLLIDTDRGAYNDYKLTRELAERLGCPRMNLEELREGRLNEWLEDN